MEELIAKIGLIATIGLALIAVLIPILMIFFDKKKYTKEDGEIMTQKIRFKIRLLLLVPLFANGYLLIFGQQNGILLLIIGASVLILIIAIAGLSEFKPIKFKRPINILKELEDYDE
jgi:hypothetical protein